MRCSEEVPLSRGSSANSIAFRRALSVAICSIGPTSPLAWLYLSRLPNKRHSDAPSGFECSRRLILAFRLTRVPALANRDAHGCPQSESEEAMSLLLPWAMLDSIVGICDCNFQSTLNAIGLSSEPVCLAAPDQATPSHTPLPELAPQLTQSDMTQPQFSLARGCRRCPMSRCLHLGGPSSSWSSRRFC